MLTTKDSSITTIIKKFEEYGEVSGNKINIAKTSIMNIGPDNKRQTPPLNLKVVEEIKIYGLHFTNKEEQTTIKSWDDILVKCEKQEKAYENKPTTIFGRVRIVNSKIVPQALYQLNIFRPPTKFFKEYRKIIWQKNNQKDKPKGTHNGLRGGRIKVTGLRSQSKSNEDKTRNRSNRQFR